MEQIDTTAHRARFAIGPGRFGPPAFLEIGTAWPDDRSAPSFVCRVNHPTHSGNIVSAHGPQAATEIDRAGFPELAIALSSLAILDGLPVAPGSATSDRAAAILARLGLAMPNQAEPAAALVYPEQRGEAPPVATPLAALATALAPGAQAAQPVEA